MEFLYHEVLRLDLGELPRPRPPRLLLLNAIGKEEVDAAVDATRRLQGRRGLAG